MVDENDPLAHIPAWLTGAFGGGATSIAQFVGGQLNECLQHLFWGEAMDAAKLAAVFVVATVLLMGLGAVVGFFVQAKTRNRWTIFLAGASATALLTMAIPGLKPLVSRLAETAVSTAFAGDSPTCNPNSGRVTFAGGLRAFFGLDEQRYRVVAGSFKKPEDGWAIVNRIKESDPALKPFVDDKAPCNEFYPVVVSSDVSLSEAKRIQERVLKLDFVPGAYLSPVR